MLQTRFFFSLSFFCFSPRPLSHMCTHMHTDSQSLAQRLTRPSCSWTQAHLTAWDPGFAPAKNSLGLTVSVADPSGMENPEMSGSPLIFCREGRGGPAKCLLNYRHVPSSVGQDKAGSKEAVVVASGCGCSGGDGCDDRWKRGKDLFQIYSSFSTSLLFPLLSTIRFPTRVSPELVKDMKSLLLELLQKQSRVSQVDIKACFILNGHVPSKPICKHFFLCACRPVTILVSILLENCSAVLPQGQKGMRKPHLLYTWKKGEKRKKVSRYWSNVSAMKTLLLYWVYFWVIS